MTRTSLLFTVSAALLLLLIATLLLVGFEPAAAEEFAKQHRANIFEA